MHFSILKFDSCEATLAAFDRTLGFGCTQDNILAVCVDDVARGSSVKYLAGSSRGSRTDRHRPLVVARNCDCC